MTTEEKIEDRRPKQSFVQKTAHRLSFLHYVAFAALVLSIVLSAFKHH